MAIYSFPKPTYLNELRLLNECVAAGLPATDVQDAGDGTIRVITSRDLTAPEQTTLSAVVAAHDGRPRRKRRVYDVYQAIGALTAAQKTNIANDLFAGSPPKFALDEGTDSPDLLVLWTLQQVGGLSTADKNLVKQAAAAIYTRDNPTYLVQPAFDPSINVPGDEPYIP